MVIPGETVLLAAAKAGWTAFSALWDQLTKRRKTKQYEEKKQMAFRELLKGDDCNWDYVDSVIAQGKANADVAPDTFRLKSLRAAAGRVAHADSVGVRKTGVRKKPAAKHVSKKIAAKRRPATK